MAPRSFQQHLDPAVGPKRILALDGGGLRGVLTVAILKRIEDVLREKTAGGPEFRLSDYYDLIGGTSTGSIIAAGLSLGWSVDEIRAHYYKLGQDVFKPGLLSFGVINPRYDAAKVVHALKEVFGERTLGSSDFRTGLMVMSKRLDTGSPWPLTNHPKARYFAPREGSKSVPNRDYPLWSVVRASTAAPTFFDPESVVIKAADPSANLPEVRGEFVDGGVSTANNPSLQLVLTATVPGYAFGWAMGEDQLAVTSVGTGRASSALGLSTGMQSLAAAGGIKALSSLLEDCADLVETMMQWMSRSPTARELDREMGTLEGCHPGSAPSLAYHRYNVHFEPAWFKGRMDMDIGKAELDELAKMDKPGNMKRLEQIGVEAAKRFVKPEHFGVA